MQKLNYVQNHCIIQYWSGTYRWVKYRKEKKSQKSCDTASFKPGFAKKYFCSLIWYSEHYYWTSATPFYVGCCLTLVGVLAISHTGAGCGIAGVCHTTPKCQIAVRGPKWFTRTFEKGPTPCVGRFFTVTEYEIALSTPVFCGYIICNTIKLILSKNSLHKIDS